MYKRKYTALVIVLLVVLSACTKGPSFIEEPPPPPPAPPAAPVASFTYSAGLAPFRHKLTFTNTSTNSTSYLWEFGDSSTSTELSPVHAYKAAGNYEVTLTANGPGGIHTIKKAIAVAGPPTRFAVTSVTLFNYSAAVNYDAGSYADAYFVMANNTGFTYSDRKNYSLNLNPSVTKTWAVSPFVVFTPLTEPVILTFWDADEVELGDGDDLMDSFVFTPADYTAEPNAYPTQITLTGKNVICAVKIEWQ